MSLAEKSNSRFWCDIFLYVVRLIASVAIARILGPAAMGLWIILTMIPSYAEAFGRFKVDIAAVFYLGKGKYKLGETAFVLNIVALFSSAILILIFLWQRNIFYTYLFKGVSDVNTLVYLILLIIPMHFLIVNYSYLLIYLEDMKSYNSMLILKELLSSFLAIVSLVFLKWGVLSMIVSTLIGGFSALIYGVWKVQKKEHMVPNFNLGIIKDLFQYSKYLYVVGLVSQLNTYVSSLIVAFYLIPSQLAFFRMGQDKAQILNKIPDAINTILYPRISKGSNTAGESENLAARCCRVSFLLLSVFGLLAALLIKPAVFILYGKEYLPLTISFWLLLPGIIFLGAAGPLNQYFMGIGRPITLLWISIIPFVTQIGLGLILIPRLGVIGAAITTTLSFILMSFITMLIFKRFTRISLVNIIFSDKADIKIVLDFIRKQLSKVFSTGINRRNVN
jgi:O-antigen/teichoic acid export membrane protein